MIHYGSVCSGIEGAAAAWDSLGWKADWLSEIEKFPNAVLRQRYPEAPNFGDMLSITSLIEASLIEAPDVLVGGTPCQSFSVAGLRGGLHDPRGQLTYTFVEIANAIDAVRVSEGKPECVTLWENVPGVLSDKTNAFGCLLAGLAGEAEELVPPGKRWSDAGFVLGPQRVVAWRILDAQYFGLAQRRRRVFVMASARKGFDPRAVLFEFEGVRRDIAPSRETGQDVTGTLAARTNGGGGLGTDLDLDGGLQVAHTLKEDGFDASEDGTGRDTPLVPSISRTLNAGSMGRIDFETETMIPEIMPTMQAGSSTKAGHNARLMETKDSFVVPDEKLRVRRLTPRECERLQGFDDDHTLIYTNGKPAADGPRYKALGNAFAVPVIRWIGQRIAGALE